MLPSLLLAQVLVTVPAPPAEDATSPISDAPSQPEKPSEADAEQTPWIVARYDYSQGSHRYGAGYHFGELYSGEALAWWSFGPELLLTTNQNTSFEVFEPTVRGRMGGMGHAGVGGSLEAGLTLAFSDEAVTPAATAGVLANIAIVEAGVLGQWPLSERPASMPTVWFATRLHVPSIWLD